MISVAIGIEFEYHGRRHEHIFWSISDLHNYFRWEPDRARLVGFVETGATNTSLSRSGSLKLIATNGQVIKEKLFATYKEIVDFIELKGIVIQNVEKRTLKR